MVDFIYMVLLELWGTHSKWESQNEKFWPTVGFEPPTFRFRGGHNIQLQNLSRLQLASANRVAALTSHDGILWVQGIPDVKKWYRESIENAYFRLNKGCLRDKFVIRSVTDVLRTQSRFVKCVGGSACGLTPPQILQTYFGPEVRQKQTL